MRRFRKIALIVAGSLAGLVIVLFAAALIVVQTGWFRNLVRERIVREVETATGGRAEIRSFSLDWKKLTAEVRDFVIHGTEGPDEPPFVRVGLLQVGLKVVSALKRDVDIAYLGVHRPQVYIRIARDGSTNIPKPRSKREPSGKDPIETVLDLAIRRFEITNGWLRYASRKTPLDVRGENLRANLKYDLAQPRYTGDVAIAPVFVQGGGRQALPVNAKIALEIERDRIEITSATLDTPASRVMFTAEAASLAEPSGTLRLNGKVSAAEIASAFGNPAGLDARRSPPLYIALAGGIAGDRVDLTGLQVSLGASRFQAEGALTSLRSLTGEFDFYGNLAVGEIGRVLSVSGRPEGSASLEGRAQITGRDYRVTAGIAGRGLGFGAGGTRISDATLKGRVAVDPRIIAVNDLRVAALGGRFTGSGELRDRERFRAAGRIDGFELRRLARTFASRELVWSGTISGPVEASGSLRGKPARQMIARAGLRIAPGREGVPLSGNIDVLYDGPRALVSLGNSHVLLPATRLDLSGEIGNQLRVAFHSRDLNDLLPAIALASEKPPKELPVRLANGAARFNGTVTGSLDDPRIAGRASITNFLVREQKFDQFSAEVNAAQSGASVKNAVASRGKLSARADASVGLRKWKPEPDQPVEASATVRNAKIEDVLALAGRRQVEVKGDLTVDARVSGAVGDPRATAEIVLSDGVAYREPFERFAAKASYTSRAVELSSLEFVAAGGKLEANASFEHPPNQFETGSVTFHVASSGMKLERLRTLQLRQPGLSGAIELKADGKAAIDTRPGKPRILFSALEAAFNARAVEADRKDLGNLSATATTTGKDLVFRLESDLAESKIQGEGKWVLDGDFPVDARLKFAPVRLASVRRLIAQPRPGQSRDFDGVIEGEIEVAGPTVRPKELRGALRLSRVELSAPGVGTDEKKMTLALQNRGPVVVTLDRSRVRIEQARLAGKSTDIALGGAVLLDREDSLDLRANGTIGLELLEQISPGVYASGAIALNAGVKGRPSQPLLDGRVELRNASVNMADAPNGISNANGVVRFNGNQAVIEKLTGESGGGKIALGGFVRYAGKETDFRLRATAKQVRVRYPPGSSTKVDAQLDFSGTPRESVLGGSVTITEAAFHSQTDFGSMLSRAGAPPQAPEAKTGLLGGMRMNVRIDTAPGTQFRTTLAQNIQVEADMELRGTPSQPGLIGRAAVTQGQVVFFGHKYNINHGTISFFNPQKVEPVLDVDLQTRARGVEVFLSVSGPMDKLNLAYRSDPPLQFSDIVSLLATGKTPTSDPVLAMREPPAPEQNLQQLGASALLGQAVANPVSGRLQRLFGVTKLKIDPQITGAENNPQARLTLEQQISKDLYFTYIQDLTESNPQVVRVEWAFDPTWSAIAVRQENGQFGLDFYYKKRFR